MAHIFRKLRNPKNVQRQMSEKSRLRGVLDKQHRKRAQALFKSERQRLYDIY